MKKYKIILSLFMTMLLLFSLCSCAKSEDAIYDDGFNYVSGESMDQSITSKPSVDSSFGGNKNNYYDEVDKEAAIDTGSSSESDEKSEFEDKIIKNMWIESETKDFDNALEQINSFIQKYNGYIESSNVSGRRYEYNHQRRSSKMVVRIPAENLDAFVSDSNQIVNVINTTSTVENVTVEYYDLQSRRDVLIAEKDALNQMLQKADTIDNMLRIRNQLTNVISDIESIETKLRVYDSLVSYSTVTLTIDEVIEYTDIKTEEPTWGMRIKESFVDSWIDFADGFQDFTVWFIGAIPTFLVLGIIATFLGLLAVVLVKYGKRKKNK